jgi:hypothetical protein
MSGELCIPYQVKTHTLALGIIFFGGTTVFLLALLITSEGGSILDRARELVGGIAGAGMFVATLFALHVRLRRKPVLVLGTNSLRFPTGMRWREVEISYADISNVTSHRRKLVRYLTVQLRNGRSYSIMASMLPSRIAFDQVRSILDARRNGNPIR